ncbi:MAG: hypothetical protein WC096_07695 [Sphaerochaetaceae bacterium]|jgi:hypothetical protein
MSIGRPRKKPEEIHDIELKVRLTEEQYRTLMKLANQKDIPKSVLGRQLLIQGLEHYLTILTAA